MKHKHYMEMAFEAAFEGMNHNLGGPFGSVIVLKNEIIATGCNHVTSTNDPTAHAEVTAIRKACAHIKHFDLSGSTIYATCEPCPMCLSAIYWANISEVYYCSTRFDAGEIGFADDFLYREFGISTDNPTKPIHKIDHPLGKELFQAWLDKNDKIKY